jgi:hypothetical protein
MSSEPHARFSFLRESGVESTAFYTFQLSSKVQLKLMENWLNSC